MGKIKIHKRGNVIKLKEGNAIILHYLFTRFGKFHFYQVLINNSKKIIMHHAESACPYYVNVSYETPEEILYRYFGQKDHYYEKNNK